MTKNNLLKTVVLIFLVSISGLLFSGEIIQVTTHNGQYRIPYRTAGGKLHESGNVILREIAKEVLREPWLVRIDVAYTLGLSIEKDGDKNPLSIRIKHLSVGGDTLYRRFPVSATLLPSGIRMKLRWANRADTSGYSEQTVTGKALQGGDSLVCVLSAGSFDPQVDTLLIREVEFYYDTLALQKMLARVELIHDYFASVLILDSLLQFAGDIQLDRPDRFPVNYLKVEEISRVISRIEERDFPGQLLRDGYDPLELMGRYRQMYKDSRSLVYNYMDELRKTAAIPWSGNVDLLADYFSTRIYSYVRRSFLMDQQQGHIYTDCLDHLFDNGAFPPEENIQVLLLAKMFPDAGIDTVAGYISKHFYAAYPRIAVRLMNENLYAEAFSMLENGHRFVAANPSLKGFLPDRQLESQAAEGIFNSFIGIASTCMVNHKFNMAETYLRKADQYAAAHSDYIRSDSAYRAVFSELFFMRNADCDQLLSGKKYAEALDCYQQIEQTYSPRDLAAVKTELDNKKSAARMGLGNLSAMLSQEALSRQEPDTALFYYKQATSLRQNSISREQVDSKLDSMAPVMAHIRYQQLFREGATALDKRQFTLSVSLLKEAKTLAEDQKLDRSKEFDSLYRQAMKNLLIIQLSAAQKKIWSNQFDSARLALQKTEAAGFDFGLLNDPGFIAAMEHYKIKITEQRCRNLNDTIDLRLIRADRNIALKNYVNAIRSLQQALDFSRTMKECGIAETPIMDTLAKYREVAGYQERLSLAKSRVVTGNYAEAVSDLVENQQAYQQFRLNRFGLKEESAYEFITSRNNPYLSEQAAMYYAGKENFHESFRFLALAHAQGLLTESTLLLQQLLGDKFAQEDFLQHPGGNAIDNIVKYIQEDAWFDAFRKTYLDSRNRLVKAAGSGGK
ncbi:MAG: hypothetical protein ACOYNC_01295 [Bacteroidales bacterium]